MKKLYLFIIVFFLVPFLLKAQNNQYQFSALTVGNGLSSNHITSIFKDNKGFIWFGTASGLNRYDGYNFKIFRHDAKLANSISDNKIINIFPGPEDKLWVQTASYYSIYDPNSETFANNIIETLKRFGVTEEVVTAIRPDAKGNFWFVCKAKGLFKYDPKARKTTHYTHGGRSPISLYSDDVADITINSKGQICVVYEQGTVEILQPETKKIAYKNSMLLTGRKGGYAIFADRDDDLWVYPTASFDGVFFLDIKRAEATHYCKASARYKLKSDIVSSVIQDGSNNIWVSTDHGGINVIDKRSKQTSYILNREDDDKSLRQNSMILYKDNLGIIWAGTYKEGVCYYHPNIIRFPLIRHYATDQNSLKFEDVNTLAEDHKGNIWIGTNGGGLIYYNRLNGKYTQYRHGQGNSNTLASDIIVSLCIDHENKLWIGTYFGGLDCFDGKNFAHYRHDDNKPESITDDRVLKVMEDTENRLWVGTFQGGVNIYNPKQKNFDHPYNQTQIRSPYVSQIFEDRQKNIWIGGYMGVDMLPFQKGLGIQHYSHDFADNNFKLAGNNINYITQDTKGRIWVATTDGLSILNSHHQQVKILTVDSGLPDNNVAGILEDNNGLIWISTSNGLASIKLNITGEKYSAHYRIFDETDGLQAREFNVNSALKLSSGELVFGGNHGINLFNPSGINYYQNAPKLLFTDFQVSNRSVVPGEEINGNKVLNKSITQTSAIILSHNDNVFSIEFAALNLYNPKKIRYLYKLEGFDKAWLANSNNNRKVAYTNLDAGDYTFRVKAISTENSSNTDEISLAIKVLPPFWKSNFAYFVYVLTGFCMLLFIRHRGIKKIKSKFKVEQEKLETQRIIEQEREEIKRMQELDKMKTKFLTNVSHDFRTPISLILAPVDKILKQTTSQEHRQQLDLIHRNAKRLLNMVNQLLDFRKMEVQELKLYPQNGDVIKFIAELSLSFSDMAENKNIDLVFDAETDSFVTGFDHDKLERILFNLLSNAFKFTPANGCISVLVTVKEHELQTEEKLEIKIIDTGIGIAQAQQDKIFDRFFQSDVPGSILNQGSGIGLAIVKEFVKLHKGEITLESEVGKGSCFTVMLPLNHIDVQSVRQVETPVAVSPGQSLLRNGKFLEKRPTVLLVEDNEDFRFYLKDNLNEHYQVIEANNGKEGWQKALSLHPDIIVSDISMPEMNGIDLCLKLRKDTRTVHIPVVLLTALTGEEQQLRALEIGATDYLTKPFNFEILLSKLKNILLQQQLMRSTYKKQVSINPSKVEVESPNEAFIQKILEVIEKNIPNADFSVEELSSEMCMSRVTLYKKALSFTGKSPVELIRTVRLKRAAQLLEKGHLTISQVSHKVGFKSQKYFTRSFKSEFNVLPSGYASGQSLENVG